MVKLSSRERRIAAAVFDAILPGTPDLPGAADVEMDGFIDDVIATYPPNLAYGIKALLHLVNISAFFRTGWQFTALSRDAREQHFNRWYSSRIYLLRQAAMTLKTITTLGYLGFPEIQEKVGWIKNRAMPPVDLPVTVRGSNAAGSEDRRGDTERSRHESLGASAEAGGG